MEKSDELARWAAEIGDEMIVAQQALGDAEAALITARTTRDATRATLEVLRQEAAGLGRDVAGPIRLRLADLERDARRAEGAVTRAEAVLEHALGDVADRERALSQIDALSAPPEQVE